MQWTEADAGILAAIMILDLGRGADLTEVVAAADLVNHAVVRDDEIARAMRRLLGAGLVEVRDRRIYPTVAGRAMAAEQTGDLSSQVDPLLAKLRRLPVIEREWHLDPGQLREAASAGHRRAEEILSRRHRVRRGRRRRAGD